MPSFTPKSASWVAPLALMVLGCSVGAEEAGLRQEVSALNVEITSEAFAEGSRIPRRYTCEGDDVSSKLSWGEAPDGTKSIALIADDPDAPAGTWVHWVLYGLPPDSRGLEEGGPTSDALPSGARQGTNDFGRTGYGGPCPPPGHGTHRYYFKLYALDIEVDLGPGATKSDLLRNLDGHILASGQLMGTYER